MNGNGYRARPWPNLTDAPPPQGRLGHCGIARSIGVGPHLGCGATNCLPSKLKKRFWQRYFEYTHVKQLWHPGGGGLAAILPQAGLKCVASTCNSCCIPGDPTKTFHTIYFEMCCFIRKTLTGRSILFGTAEYNIKNSLLYLGFRSCNNYPLISQIKEFLILFKPVHKYYLSNNLREKN